TLLLPHLDGKRSARDGLILHTPMPALSRASGSAGPEGERHAVHAVTETGGRRAVVEHVAEVAAAAAAVHLGADHQEAGVVARRHGVRQRGVEARPAGVALELGLRREERERAAGAEERAVAVLVHERARPGALGALLAEDVVGGGGEEGLPLRIGL